MILLNNNKKSDPEILDNQRPHLTFEQRIELLLWGDKKLGVKGIKGRIDKMGYLIKISLAFSVITSLALLEHLTRHDISGVGVMGKLFISATGLFTKLILGG